MIDQDSYLAAKRAPKPKAPASYWQARALEVAEMLGELHLKSRYLKLFRGDPRKPPSDAHADLLAQWANDSLSARNPAAAFFDRIKNPRKYLRRPDAFLEGGETTNHQKP